MDTQDSTTRAEVNAAWSQGLKAGNEGQTQAVNPYIGDKPAMAKAWFQGWQESTGKQKN